MPLAITSVESIKYQFRNALETYAGLTDFSESSIAGIIVNVASDILYNLVTEQNLIEQRLSLSTSYGTYLDNIGATYGITRLPSKAATTVGAGYAMLFSNPTSMAIAVPEGTRIWSEDNYNLAFYTTLAATVPAADVNGNAGTAYVDVEASGTGDSFNVTTGVLTQHNVGSQFLTCTNVRPIQNGQALESDDNYRYRISNALLARRSTKAGLYTRLLEMPSVRDAIIQPLSRGAGTIDVVIVPIERYVTDALLIECQAVAEDAVAPGISVKCIKPIELPVDLTIALSVTPTSDKSIVRTAVSSAVREYIDNLMIGSETEDDSSEYIPVSDIILSSLITVMKNSSPDVRDVSITEMRISNKKVVIGNHAAGTGERFYLQSIKVV